MALVTVRTGAALLEELELIAEPWVSVEDVAKHLGVAKDSIYRWIETKGLPAKRIGRLWKFKLSEVDQCVNAGGAADTPPTDDNATAHTISRRFLLPVITHQTRVTERSRILERIRDGRYSAVVTSRVLNEGVDVPDASVAVVVSGSGSVREHVQRLGRVLRKRGDKRAVLYELISGDTSEQHTSERRRDHVAWSGSTTRILPGR